LGEKDIKTIPLKYTKTKNGREELYAVNIVSMNENGIY
jgi:hypothetical protein